MVGGRGGRRERRGETGNVKLVVEHLVVEHLFWCGVWSQWMYVLHGTVYITNVESKLFLKEA
jgi:hypothetical protein